MSSALQKPGQERNESPSPQTIIRAIRGPTLDNVQLPQHSKLDERVTLLSFVDSSEEEVLSPWSLRAVAYDVHSTH